MKLSCLSDALFSLVSSRTIEVASLGRARELLHWTRHEPGKSRHWYNIWHVKQEIALLREKHGDDLEDPEKVEELISDSLDKIQADRTVRQAVLSRKGRQLSVGIVC
jgi:hypothetical protein